MRALTAEEISALRNGTVIKVTWSGGNGPHEYRIRQTVHGSYAMSEWDWRHDRINWSSKLDFIGTARPYTIVRLAHPPAGVDEADLDNHT